MRKNIYIFILIAILVAFLGLFIGCNNSDSNNISSTNNKTTEIKTNIKNTVSTILGRGATFPEPLYQEMFLKYKEITGIEVNYSGVGSGKGISGLNEKIVEFGATDAFMNEEEIKNAGAEILHLPTCIGAIAIAYNLDIEDIKLTGNVLAEIFMGKITKWNDTKIADLNPEKQLPDESIRVVHRSEGSGTTFVFTEYLSKINPEWSTTFGAKKEISWTVGIGAKGNDGVTNQIKEQYGAIGYIEISYAIENNLPVAMIQNKSGNFITPSLESASLAAQGEIPDDTRVSITNTENPNGYPISTFTWLILYKEQNYNGRTIEQAKALANLMLWIVTDGQQFNEKLYYAKLPEKVVEKAKKIIKSITYKNMPIL